jgi:hypothetical protein
LLNGLRFSTIGNDYTPQLDIYPLFTLKIIIGLP